MPIRQHHRWLYPIDWRELSQSIRFRRAGGRCERYGRPHGREVVAMHDGRWWDEDARAWRCGHGKRLRRTLPPHSTILPMRRTRVVLSACHLMHDAPEHRRRRAVTVRARWALGDLFMGPYPP